MSAALAKVAICLACKSSLRFCHWFNYNLRFFDQVIKTPAGDGIAASVDDECSFNEIGGRDATACTSFNGKRTVLGFGFVTKDRDQRRCVDDHRGNPPQS